jgi:hypothetical protein
LRPHYVEHWRLGFEGERRTAKELRRLERAGLHVAHDVQDGHGNYDHIAVGAAGVVEEDRCVFVHGSWLREWLQDRPSWLSQAEAEEVAAGIAGIARDAGAAKDVVPPAQLHPA